MSFDHFRPPEHLSPRGKLAFRVLCLVTFAAGMAVLIFVVLPWANTHAFKPFADWVIPRYFSLFGEYEYLAAGVLFLLLAAPWLLGHFLLRRRSR